MCEMAWKPFEKPAVQVPGLAWTLPEQVDADGATGLFKTQHDHSLLMLTPKSTPHKSFDADIHIRKFSVTDESMKDFGPQPLAELMAKHQLKPHDLVAASTEQITHKMVARGCKGRKLSARVQYKLLTALNGAAGQQYQLGDLFNYPGG